MTVKDWSSELGSMQLAYDHGVRFYTPNTDRVGSIYPRQPHITCSWMNCRQARMIDDPKVVLHGVRLADPEPRLRHATGTNSRTGTLYYPPSSVRCKEDPRSSQVASSHFVVGKDVIPPAVPGSTHMHIVKNTSKHAGYTPSRPRQYVGPFAATQ